MASRAPRASTRPCCYYYFRGREELAPFYARRCAAGDVAFGASKPGSKSHFSPRERLVGFVNGYLTLWPRHPTYPRLVRREGNEAEGQSLRWIVRVYFGPLYRQLAATIRAGVPSAANSGAWTRNIRQLSLLGMTIFLFCGRAGAG